MNTKTLIRIQMRLKTQKINKFKTKQTENTKALNTMITQRISEEILMFTHQIGNQEKVKSVNTNNHHPKVINPIIIDTLMQSTETPKPLDDTNDIKKKRQYLIPNINI